MRAMILAAGRGERMGKLTDDYPKPLLRVAGRYLIEYTLSALVNAGIDEVIINVCYRRELIQEILGDGHRYNIKITYSIEEKALETGGGIYQALPWLGQEPFLVMSGDIMTDYPLNHLLMQPEKLAHIILVDNPSYHLKGDFALQKNQVTLMGSSTLTFGNIGLFRPEFFATCQPGRFRLGDVLKEKIMLEQVTGESYSGLWFNIGTPDELSKAEAALSLLP